MNISTLAVGQRVEINDGRVATIRFVGNTNFQVGDWVGVELEEATGKNDGSVKGERYFECEPAYGMFLRPAGVRQVLEEPQRPKSRLGGGAVNGQSKSSSTYAPGVNGLKRQSLAQGGLERRASVLAASPTPGARPGSSGVRSPDKSPTKQLSTNGAGSASTSRTNTPPAGAKRILPGTTAPKSRPSLAPSGTSVSRRTSTLPSGPTISTQRSARPSLVAPSATARAPHARTAPGRASLARAPPSQRLGPHQLKPRGVAEADEDGSERRPDLLSPGESEGATSSVPSQQEPERIHEADDNTITPSFAPPPPPPEPPDPAPRSALARRTSSPPASIHSTRTARSTAASKREIEELEAKVRLLERKRLEDRDLKRTLEQTQQERDRYQGIIEKLQKKYQPQQQEIAELKRAISEAEKRSGDVEALQAEHDSVMEMATLDREMAEETAESLKAELDALRAKNEEMELEIEVLRDENAEYSKEMSPEERTSTGWLQMEKSNERLREALLRLRDVAQDQEAELKEQIEELEGQAKDAEAVKEAFQEQKEQLLTSEANADDLREQLEAALGAEEIIEELTERNASLQEKMDELRATIEDLENLRELNDELEINHVEAEKQMQDEIDFKDSLLLDRERTAKQQQQALDDADYTVTKFRELVSQLQSDLQDMQASKQISETEAAELSTKSRAMLDLNLKLQSSAAKTQVKTIDLELRKLEAQEAAEHLAIVQLFLPDAFHAERDSVLALLRFKRIGFKANLIHGFVKERIASFGARDDIEAFAGCGVLDKLTWITAMSERFVNSICGCSLEEFASYEAALYELEPVERALNGYIDGLRREELGERIMADELQRSIAVMTHLASLHIKDDLAGHADELLMRTLYLQSQLESTASALGLIKTAVESKLPAPSADDEEDEGDASGRVFVLNRAESLVSHARSAKVMVGKTHRSLDDLQSRSLTLESTCNDTFNSAEAVASEVAAFARQAGNAMQLLFGEEGRNEPYSLDEVSNALSRTASACFSLAAPEPGPFSALAGRLRDLTDLLADLASLPSDLDNTVEFERAPAPWVARSNELKQTKITSIDTVAELARTLDTVKQRDVFLKEKETELEEQSVRIEMLEARMKDASKRSAKIAELERTLHEARDNEKNAKADLTKAQEDAQRDVERVKGEMARLAEQRPMFGNGGDIDVDAMGTGARLTVKRQEHKIKSLDGAVRYLKDENLRLRLPPPNALQAQASSLDWLHEPLTKPKTARQQKQNVLQRDGKNALQQLIKLAAQSPTVDLTKLPQNKLAWRPAKETPRWQVERRKEDWIGWKDWRRDIVRRSTQPSSRHLPSRSKGAFTNGFLDGSEYSNAPISSSVELTPLSACVALEIVR